MVVDLSRNDNVDVLVDYMWLKCFIDYIEL